ncbi:MAG TPA: chemotaxis protein CheW [Bauldia sp.]|nr:chemotaxis protein CheW [Bauldia sp.]
MRGEALATGDGRQTDRARALREAFDRGFAETPATAMAEQTDLLALSLAGHRFAIRLGEAAGLFADRKVTPAPTAMREFRGIAGVRGALVPVYDLAVLMGYAPAEHLRWLLLAREAPVAFAFDTFDGQLRLDSAVLAPHQDQTRDTVREVARLDTPRPVIHIPSVIAALRRRMPKEG